MLFTKKIKLWTLEDSKQFKQNGVSWLISPQTVLTSTTLWYWIVTRPGFSGVVSCGTAVSTDRSPGLTQGVLCDMRLAAD